MLTTKKGFEKVHCRECVFWGRLVPDSKTNLSGLCSRYPPSVIYHAIAEYQTILPETMPVDWCGEGRAK